MVKRIFALVVSLLLICCLGITAAAHPVPDLTQKGSVTFLMEFEDVLLDGGNLNMTMVGNIAEDDGNYFFTPVEALDGTELTLEDISSPFLAEELLTLAKALKLEKLTAPIEEGTAVFADLPVGLYVVYQDEGDATKGFSSIQPFLISVPRFQNNEYVLDVLARPKTALETEPPTTTTPPPKDPNLPQTGQLNWPVPVLAISGAVLLILGFLLWAGRKGDSHAG